MVSSTVFEILSLIFQKAKRSRDSEQAPLRESLSSVGWDFVQPTYQICSVYTITCNEEMNNNAKCKNSRFEPPYGLEDLRLTNMVHLWLDGKRIVDFLLVIIELFSLAFTAAALLSESCCNCRSLKG